MAAPSLESDSRARNNTAGQRKTPIVRSIIGCRRELPSPWFCSRNGTWCAPPTARFGALGNSVSCSTRSPWQRQRERKENVKKILSLSLPLSLFSLSPRFYLLVIIIRRVFFLSLMMTIDYITRKLRVVVAFGWQVSRELLQQPPHRLIRVQGGKTKVEGSSSCFRGTACGSGMHAAGVAMSQFDRSSISASPNLPVGKNSPFICRRLCTYACVRVSVKKNVCLRIYVVYNGLRDTTYGNDDGNTTANRLILQRKKKRKKS